MVGIDAGPPAPRHIWYALCYVGSDVIQVFELTPEEWPDDMAQIDWCDWPGKHYVGLYVGADTREAALDEAVERIAALDDARRSGEVW